MLPRSGRAMPARPSTSAAVRRTMPQSPPPPHAATARALLAELVAIDTSRRTDAAAHAMAARLRAGGFAAEDVRVEGPHPEKLNLVARLRGSGARPPLLLLAHLDVVPADAAEWSVPPFALTEREGHYWGRGTIDDKAMAALWTAVLLRLRAEGRTPARDVVLALTADEEGGEHNGVEWLLAERRALIEAGLGLNEGGYGRLEGGRRVANQVQLSEKIGVAYRLEARGRAGHSSLPAPDNAILRLAAALGALAAHEFPVRLNPATRAQLGRMAQLAEGERAADLRALLREPPDMAAAARLCADPYHHALLRTTCAPTRLEAGVADNVLPPLASAVVDCRILPDTDPAEVEATMRALAAPFDVEVRPLGPALPSPASPLAPGVLDAVERVTESMWPGVPVVPVMTIGATDSLRLRRAGIPMYGVSGLFLDLADARVHGPDERVRVDAFHDAAEFLYRLVRDVSCEF